MKSRVYFLIFIAALFLHVPTWQMALALAGYFVFDQLDQWRDRKFRDNLYGEELTWKQDPDDPSQELYGGLTRSRLTREHQIIVTRIGELLRRDRH